MIIIKYIIIDILSYLPLKKLIEMEQLNTLYRDIIRKNNLSYLTITLSRIENIKYDFHNSMITDESVKLLRNCHTLNFSGCRQITDKSVKLLGNCHTLNFSDCKITDKSVKFLGKCHILNLTGCKITDKSVKLLGKCHTLNLSKCW